MRALPRKDERGVRFVHPDSWHITLRFLGDTDPDLVEAALDAYATDFQPISDMRASAGYRMLVAQNLLRRFFMETTAGLAGGKAA